MAETPLIPLFFGFFFFLFKLPTSKQTGSLLKFKFCFSSVQGERNSIHKNLVFCLFVAEILFLAGVERTENKVIWNNFLKLIFIDFKSSI